MNKLATISLVTVLGVAGGGAYMAMNPDKASEFAQYIPEPVTSLMNEYIPEEYKPAFLTKNTVVETEEILEEKGSSTQQDESVVFQENNQNEAEQMQEQMQAQEQEQAQAQAAAEEVVANSTDDASGEQNVMRVSKGETQETLGKELANDRNEPVEVLADVKKEISSNPKVAKIENKIEGINAEISKLDSENERLKNTFQQILKKNRELAEQLKAIDEKLKVTN
ncbi:MAG TPA: hypothetical protein EYH38_11020 [Leucothrix sp.]|nr:hypothetical protein [Leucothrix sp.]